MNEQGSEVIHHLTSLSLRWFICKMKSLKRLSLRVFYLWHALSLTCSKCLLILAYFIPLILYRHEMEIGMKMTGKKSRSCNDYSANKYVGFNPMEKLKQD